MGVVSALMWTWLDQADSIGGRLYLEGQQAFLEQRYDSFYWFDTFLVITNNPLFPIGLILFGITIWRSDTLPRGAAILWISSMLLFPVAGLGVWAEAIQFTLIVVAGGWIAWTVLRQPVERAIEAEAQPRVQ